MSEETELKPCPCGSPMIRCEYSFGDTEKSSFYTECHNPDCGWSTGFYDTPEEAVAANNRRPIEDAMRAEIERLREIIDAEKEDWKQIEAALSRAGVTVHQTHGGDYRVEIPDA